MAHVLDLNIMEQPTLELRLRDAEHTVLHVTIPDTDLVKEFQAMDSKMHSLLSSGTKDGVDAAYALVARVISCNEEGIAVTAAELEGKYRVNLYGLIGIYKAYLGFINDIEKN